MLQVIITQSKKYSLAESAQMAIEAGVRWLILSVGKLSDEELRQECAEVINLCSEAGVILTIENRIEMARGLHLHGVFITDNSISPLKVREQLGAEAIIGTVVSSPDSAFSMEKADIDYVAFTADYDNSQQLIVSIRAAGCMIPIVAYLPDAPLDDSCIKNLLSLNFSGICGGDSIFKNSDDPVSEIAHILSLFH